MRCSINNAPYRLVYTVLDHSEIFNYLRPKPKQIEERNKKDNFYADLEESVIAEGIRNPLTIVSHSKSKRRRYFATLPPEVYSDESIVNICINGGSRLLMAERHDLKVPCIICDYERVLPGKVITTMEHLYSLHRDKPSELILTTYGIQTTY